MTGQRGRAATAKRPASRALVRDMSATASARAPIDLDLEARPAFDFLVSLMLEAEPEILPDDAAWLGESLASLSEGIRRDHRRLFATGESGMGIGWALVGAVIADPSIRTSADVVALAGRVEVADLLLHMCETDEMPDADELAAALAGDHAARAAVTGSAAAPVRSALDAALADPGGELRALRRVLRAWRERYVTLEPRISAMLERDVAARRADARALPLEDFVEKATGGVRWVADPTTRRLVMAPCYFGRPYNYFFGDRATKVICYPVADAAIDGDTAALPTATVRLFKALGDESRLRILRLLADGDLYLTEIAERMGLSKPTVSHHMVLLRAAGLVSVTETGGLTYYSLRRERLADASVDLQRLLGA